MVLRTEVFELIQYRPLDPRRGVIRFDMPGIGESPAPVVPDQLATLAPKLARLRCQRPDLRAGQRE